MYLLGEWAGTLAPALPVPLGEKIPNSDVTL